MSSNQKLLQIAAQKRAEMLRHPCILGGPQTKGDKIRIGCLAPAFSGAQKRAEMLRHPCVFGGPQTKGDKIRSGCLNPAFLGAQKKAEVLCHPCVLKDPQTRGHNQKSKCTLRATMMPLVSQSMGLKYGHTPK